MTFLPVVARELRVAARRRGTYFVRTAAAAAVIVFGVWLFLMMHRETPKSQAQGLFALLSGAAVFYSLLSGVRATSDCISREKREGTLGLLFLTDLKGYDVILGKLLANSVNVLYGVLAIVPMLGIPLLFGGITGGEVARMALVALNTLFWSLAIGMFVSAASTSARKASGLTFLIIVVLAGMLPAFGVWLQFSGKLRGWATTFQIPSPGYSFIYAFEQQYRGSFKPFWLSLGIVHVTAWAWLGLASVVARRTWHDRPLTGQRLRWRERVLSWSYGDSVQRAAFRNRLLNANAFFWLAARARLGPAFVWVVLALLGCGWIWGALKWRGEWFDSGIYVTTAIILNVLIKGWFASEVGRQLADERQNGTLELLLSTPLRVRDILAGQRLALERLFLVPAILVLVINFVFLLATRSTSMPQSERGAWSFFWLAVMIMFFADLIALYWVGLWQALTAKNPHAAATSTVAKVLVLPWMVFLLIVLFMALASSGGNSTPEPGPPTFIGLWLVLGLLTDLGFGLVCREKLLTDFREVASQRYGARAGFWDYLLKGDQATAANAPAISQKTE